MSRNRQWMLRWKEHWPIARLASHSIKPSGNFANIRLAWDLCMCYSWFIMRWFIWLPMGNLSNSLMEALVFRVTSTWVFVKVILHKFPFCILNILLWPFTYIWISIKNYNVLHFLSKYVWQTFCCSRTLKNNFH